MEPGQLRDASNLMTLATGDGSSPSNQDNSSSCEPSVDPNMSNSSKLDEILKDAEPVSYICKTDVVRSKTGYKIGIVTKVPGGSDLNSSDTDEDKDADKEEEAGSKDEHDEYSERSLHKNADGKIDDNNDNRSPLTIGHVRIRWMDEPETTERTSDVTIVDRGFLHGDYVASDPTGQIGIVVDVNISVDLLTHDQNVLKDIPSTQLKRVREFMAGDHVVLGPWLGRIQDVFDNVTVLLDDGSVCKVMKTNPLRLKPVGKNFLEDGHFPYYPGLRVKASSSSVLKNSRWLSGLWKANQLEGTVTEVTVGSMLIYWIVSTGYGPDSDNSPDVKQSPEGLKLLSSCFTRTNWKVGDWCLLQSLPNASPGPLEQGPQKSESQDYAKYEPESTETGDESDAELTATEEPTGSSKLMENDLEPSLTKNSETTESNDPVGSDSCRSLSDHGEAVQELRTRRRKKIRSKIVIGKGKKARINVETFERALLIINTKTKVDVRWQDGRVEHGLNATSLIPIDNRPEDHDFVPEQYVVEKAADENMETDDPRRVGVVKSVNARNRTACVRWLNPVARAEDTREFNSEELVSVYQLEGHGDYFHGDIVVRQSPASLPTKMDSSVAQTNEGQQLDRPDEPNHANMNDTSSEFSGLSWFGTITGLKDGDIEVAWADGMVSTIGPQAIYVIFHDEDYSTVGGSCGSDDASSRETVEDANAETVDLGNEDDGADNVGGNRSDMEDGNIDVENSGENGALSRGRKQSDFVNSDGKSEENPQCDELHVNGDLSHKSSSQKPCDVEDQFSKISTETLCKSNLPELYSSASDKTATTFRGFNIIRDPSDHYFISKRGLNVNARKWLKKVQQDWDILQNNLPEGIYIRVYEDRMDLLRAVVIGAYGTPYQDGLFFFDFHLPPEYPDIPPLVHYHSGGWRLNPNLDENGKVCLSLLNTWKGRGNEVWDPSTSSILQLLVSFQGLVLNSRPYFNEAGYDILVGTAEGEKKSLSYNENTFLLNCKTMMNLMRKPPKDFEEIVVQHFRERGYYILKACGAYMKGHMIGSLGKDASIVTDGKDNDSNSVGFRLMLAKVVTKLYAALSEVGADCQEFSHLT